MDNQKPMPPLWIFLPGLLLVIALAFLNAVKPRILVILEAGLLAPCLAGIFCCVLRWKASRVLAIFVVSVYWMGLGALAILILTNGVFLLLYYGIFIVPVVVIVTFATRSARKRMLSRWISVGAGLGFACGVIVVTIVMASAIRRATQIFPAAPSSRAVATR